MPFFKNGMYVSRIFALSRYSPNGISTSSSPLSYSASRPVPQPGTMSGWPSHCAQATTKIGSSDALFGFFAYARLPAHVRHLLPFVRGTEALSRLSPVLSHMRQPTGLPDFADNTLPVPAQVEHAPLAPYASATERLSAPVFFTTFSTAPPSRSASSSFARSAGSRLRPVSFLRNHFFGQPLAATMAYARAASCSSRR